MRTLKILIVLLAGLNIHAYTQDSTEFDIKAVTLSEVVVRSNLNVPAFIRHVKDDTTFQKAFLNLKVLGYTSLNDVRMLNKQGKVKASLSGRTRQETFDNCRWTRILEEKVTGDFFDRQRELNYYTAQLYSSIFFAPDTVCGESNIVAGTGFSTQGKSGISKHKEQLKMLFFNPGKKIPGIPFIGNKIALFDEEVVKLYDFFIDLSSFRGEMCYEFRIVPRENLTSSEKNQIVINEMVTWFHPATWEIRGRNYDLSYRAGVYDFDVHMQVEMTRYKDYIVPAVMRYNGSWNVLFKKRNGNFYCHVVRFHR